MQTVKDVKARRNIEDLSDAELLTLKKAYRTVQKIRDDRGFNHIAGFHAVPFHYCHIESPYWTFLPWHRAYTYWFEQVLKDVDPTVSLPYWDWTSASTHQTGIPKAFATRLEIDGTANPLFSSEIVTQFENRLTKRTPLAPALLSTSDYEVTVKRVDDLIQTDLFDDFTQDLEDRPHGSVHVWTGGMSGDMSTTNYAAFDPIFFSHHCMIDRIWYLWQQKHGIKNIRADLLDRTLIPFGIKVNDLLDISSLGYTYN